MPIKVYRNKFEHVHENIFFRKLALSLIEKYKRSNEHAIFIGNPVIIDQDGNAVAPDALFITRSSFVIIDFKNYSGELHLPNQDNFAIESWMLNGKPILGGNQKNPYVQLSKHRKKIGEYLDYHRSNFLSKKSKFHNSFIDCVVSFTKEVNINGNIPKNDSNWFFISDKTSIISVLDDITGTRIRLSEGDLDRLAHLFSTTRWNPNEGFIEETEGEFAKPKLYQLTNHQQEIFKQIESFLKNEEEQVFVLSGSFSCGKTFLINHLLNHIPKGTVKGCEVLAPNNRIARNVRKQVESVSTLYSYAFQFSEEVEVSIEEKELEVENEIETNTENELTDTKLLFDIKENRDSERFLYIVDEAHHLTDSGFISDTIQFGTGYLLADFLTFSGLPESKRKIIFIGDKYRLGMGSFEESALCVDYLKSHYFLNCNEAEMQPYPPTNNNIVKQAFNIREQIVKDQYNQLELIDSDVVKVSKSDDYLKKTMSAYFGNDLYNTKILSFSNDSIVQSNNWIRKNVLNKGRELEIGDLVIIDNDVIVAPDNPFAVPQRIFKGEFAEVVSVGVEVEPITQRFKGREPVVIKYRELKLKLIERKLEVTVLHNLNYWLSNEVARAEYIAIRIYINKKINAIIKKEKLNSEEWQTFIKSKKYIELIKNIKDFEIKLANGDQVKTKLKEAKANLNKAERKFWKKRRIQLNKEIKYHDKYLNALHLNYGYALTVHKAQSYKWKNVFFNLKSEGRGTSNKSYFKWLYSGIGCAYKHLYLVNPPYITPYSKMEWRDNHNCIVNTNNNEFFPFSEDTPITLIEKPTSFDNQNDILYRFYCWLTSELNTINVKVDNVIHHNYAEHYTLKNNKGDQLRIIIWYDGQNKFKRHQVANSNSEAFKEQIDDFLINLKSNSVNSSNRLIQFGDPLINNVYEHLKPDLNKQNIELISVTQMNNSDRFTLQRENETITLDIFLNSEGFLTTVYPIRCNNTSLYDDIKLIIYDFIENHGESTTTS